MITLLGISGMEPLMCFGRFVVVSYAAFLLFTYLTTIKSYVYWLMASVANTPQEAVGFVGCVSLHAFTFMIDS